MRSSASATGDASSSGRMRRSIRSSLARFVASQRGAQFTPDGTLKFVLKATAAEEVLRALRTICKQLAAEESAW